MRKIILFGCFIIPFVSSLQAQVKPSISKNSRTETKTVIQEKSILSVQDLLIKLDNLGTQNGLVLQHFSPEEQQRLKSYLNSKSSIQSDKIVNYGPGDLTTVYGINNSLRDLVGFEVATPETTEIFGRSPIVNSFEAAGAIDPANPTTGYVLDNGGHFYSFDVITGFYTSLGTIAGDWVGMEFDRLSGTLYALTAGADIYTINPVAVTATLVGSTGIPSSSFPIALAIDGAGVGYTYEILTDTLYRINLATGSATLIGSIGFDSNFAQGMCYDPTTDAIYMSAFNNATFKAEWRSVNTTTGATTVVGEIVTAAVPTQMAWASVGETLDAPTCPRPTNLMVSNISETSADFSWTAEQNASGGYMWYVFLEGSNPLIDPEVTSGINGSGNTTANASGLTNGEKYDFYVVANCDADGLSSYAGPLTFQTLFTGPSCGEKFYDNGGPSGNYQNPSNLTTVIRPIIVGDAVTVTFLEFNTEANWDALYVYDGPNSSAPIISSGNPATIGGFPEGGYYGTTIPGPFTSSHSSGALTFVFLSDDSESRSGWEADVTCSPLGIADNTINEFSFYPNPASTILNLKSVDKIESAAIFNMLGQLLKEENINASTAQMDISGLSNGSYILNIKIAGKTGVYRIVKN